jgi:hydroxymethylbilane synthase
VAVEVMAGSPLEGLLRSLNHLPTWYEVTAERAFLAHMGLGCVCPIGVSGKYSDGEMELAADIFSDGRAPGSEGGRITVASKGAVASEDDASLLASRLWDEVRGKPLMKSLSSIYGRSGL